MYFCGYSSSLEYIVSASYSQPYSPAPTYFSRFVDEKYVFGTVDLPVPLSKYTHHIGKTIQYENSHKYGDYSVHSHSFSPQIFLSPSRPVSRFVDDIYEIKNIADEIFELMMKEKIPNNISISILPAAEFRIVHSRFGTWNNGIMGFSFNGPKKIFAKENPLDELLIVIGHEIGHVLTKTLPNKHDEEAKAFAFSIEWTKTIKKHNVANLGLSIKDDLNFNPARNGLHDIAFGFIDFMAKKGRKAIDLHSDLVKGYASVFGINYR